jgi:hypothetical protein
VQAGACILLIFSALALAAPALTRLHVLHEPIQQDLNGLDEEGMPRQSGGAYVLGQITRRDARPSHLWSAGFVNRRSYCTLTATLLESPSVSPVFMAANSIAPMRFTEMNMTLPAILLAIAFAGLMNGKIVHLHPASFNWHIFDVELKSGMVSLFLIIGFVCWPGMVRSSAHRCSPSRNSILCRLPVPGCLNGRLIFRHILPNILPTIIVLAAMTTAGAISLEAGLGYLGIGVPPPAPTWGTMIAEGQSYFIAAPMIVIAPGVAIVLTVLAFNLIGQGLQEALEPRQPDEATRQEPG